MNEDLKLVSTTDLIGELFDRYDHCVIGLERSAKVGTELRNYKLRWKGGTFVAAGLCSALQDDINHYRISNEEKVDEND